MESLGDKIRKTREEKGMSLDQAARDTHITRRFLEAIENEDYGALPGESYVIGFSRSYCEYLGLDADEMLQLYRNIKLQEQPAPMVELLEKRGLHPVVKILLGLLVLISLVFGAWYLYSTAPQASDLPPAAIAPKVPEGTVVFDGKVLERTFVSGTRFRFPLASGDKDIILIVKNDAPGLQIGTDQLGLLLDETAVLDLDNDGLLDIRFLVRSIDLRAKPPRLVVRVDRKVEGEAVTELSPLGAKPDTSISVSKGVLDTLPAAGVSSTVGRQRSVSVLRESSVPADIAVSVQFLAPVFYRYQSDAGTELEKTSTTNETLSLSAKEVLRLWVSDGSQAKLTLGDKTIALGNPGELAAWQLLWLGNTGSYRLELQPLY